MYVVWAIASIAAILWGGFSCFGFMMSDDPSQAEKGSSRGCIIAVLGIVSFILCLLVYWMHS